MDHKSPARTAIQWFPGHMAKARRQMQESLKLVDMVIELRDCRIPRSSRNPMLDELIQNKPRLIILSKKDKGDPQITRQWIEALSGPQETIEAMRKVFEERRNYLVSRLNSIPGVSCITPNGAFYVMMNIEKLIGRTLGGRLIENDDDFGVAFLEKGLVAVVPCSGFGIKNFVRWTYATSMENIKEGLDRLEKFLAE